MQITKKRSGRGWRVLIPRHSTVVAYAALILATGGTAVAATGAAFRVGHVNKAAATSGSRVAMTVYTYAIPGPDIPAQQVAFSFMLTPASP
jgi:hypothetical protein